MAALRTCAVALSSAMLANGHFVLQVGIGTERR